MIEYLDGKAEGMENATKYNNRLGRYLDVLFYADSHSLMSEASAIKIHNLRNELKIINY
ncbi:MAG: hypothetical protein PF482_07945 [Desulfobacteraceae bacterium]|nr:hypothetical protein [Desulfobacteraceae bacterium]